MNTRQVKSSLIAFVIIILVSGCDSADSSDPNTFYVAFENQVEISETPGTLACNNGPQYSLGHPTYTATFQAVDGATGYTGRIRLKDGTFANEAPVTNLDDLGNQQLQYSIGVGSIHIYLTCSLANAESERQDRLDYLDQVGHQGIEITARLLEVLRDKKMLIYRLLVS